MPVMGMEVMAVTGSIGGNGSDGHGSVGVVWQKCALQ
jgi:hypothetical protein